VKSIILRQHEVIHLHDTGSVIVWRVVKPQPKNMVIDGVAHLTIGMDPAEDGDVWYDADCINPGVRMICPYGRTGEERWVRETWYGEYVTGRGWQMAHLADGDEYSNSWDRGFSWRSPILMNEAQSRFTVTLDIGLKRIQGVTEEEAKMSGAPEQRYPHGGSTIPHFYRWHGLREIIQAKNKSDWDLNLWHWKITCTLKK